MRVYYAMVCWLFCFAAHDLCAQRITVETYINTYSDWAISEMKRSGIPASITLAQGMLESGNGNSQLAIDGKNHFGIKCHEWKGEKIYFDDDKKNECFRKYKNAQESFTDHTDFLVSQRRYAFLFEYKSTDYKKWATGLSKAGYATDPKYAQKLIDLIERYELSQYDTGVTPPKRSSSRNNQTTATARNSTGNDFGSFSIEKYPIRENNRTSYITAKEGDSYYSLSNELDLMPWQLPKYNEANAIDKLYENQIVYLQQKRRKAEKGNETHTVSEGETMYGISQKYAVKVARLYMLNRMEDGTQPKAGDVLNLRKKKRL